jgi:hypothetical protein
MSTRRSFLRHLCLAVPGSLLAGSPGTVERGIQFLRSRQSSDGAWHSAIHGSLRDGSALTPLVLNALPDEKGLAWLRALTDRVSPSTEPWTSLVYPLFTASLSAQVFAKAHDDARARFWASLIQRLQLSPSLGWPENDPRCHGWGDSPCPPRFDPSMRALADMQNPNLSATAYAIAGLAAAGMPARPDFVLRCQNADGGFFFALNDPIRNKAGDRQSYSTATCDGILSLRHAGVPSNDPRIRSAIAWLQKNTSPPPPSLTFYDAQARARCLASPTVRESLLSSQNADGSWQGSDPAALEDDPVLATAFALMALTASRPARGKSCDSAMPHAAP